MSSSDGETGAGELRGRRNKGSPLLVLAAGLLMFAAIVGATFILLRPTTLRIAVGPSGSTDQQLIQGLAQHFAQENSAVRLSVITTAGPVDSIAALAAGNADLAVGRADEEMPDGTESVAILRKNVVVLWAASSAPPKAPRKPAKSRIKAIGDLPGHRVGVVGRTKVNVTLLRVILKESGVDPDKVEVAQFGNDQVTDMVKDAGVDAFMLVGPVDSKLTAEAISTSARIRGEPVFLPIDVSEAIAARHAAYESEEIPGSSFTTSPARPDDKVETVSINHLIVAPKSLSEATVGT
ncbi:MAG: ABC transporter substrate-binding protein, partial [Bradyrhizobium sp.]